MKRVAWLVLGAGTLALGCGGGEGVENLGFQPPPQNTEAYSEVSGVWERQGTANWSCLNTASDDVATTVEITLTGLVDDFQTGNAVPNATVTAFDNDDVDNPFATTTSDEDGNYTLTIPAGRKRFGFKMVADGAMDTLLLNQYLDPNEANQTLGISSVSELTANALPAFIGVTRTPGLGVLAGAMRDCDDHEVNGAIATVSATSAVPDHLDGASSYYFSAGSTSLPVRLGQQAFTNYDGLFMVIELPPTSQAYLQVWGFPDGTTPTDSVDDLQLLAEISSPVIADVMVTFSLEPLRTN